jgi:oxygen-dependent protoporphyrinogen oxidase
MDNEDEVYDCIIVGGGLAGLCAAYSLKDKRILVLEISNRPGGRINSQSHGAYWLNLGAHMFGGPGTLIGDLVTELGLESRLIRGVLLGMSLGGKRLLKGPIEMYPLRLPLPVTAKISMIRMGLALRQGTSRLMKTLKPEAKEAVADTRKRVLNFKNDYTLSEMIGQLHPEVSEILTAITERTGGDPSEIAAGYALRSFTNVWSQHSPGRNLFGGSSGLPEALAQRLGERIRYGHRVDSIERYLNNLILTVSVNGESRRMVARSSIVATPAFITSKIVRNLPSGTVQALNAVRYGAFLSAAILTNERMNMPWDENYAISTPRLSFSVLFNQATTLRETQTRMPGGSLMLFRGGLGAERMMQKSDSAIESAFVTDLAKEFPESRHHIRDVIVRRWEAGAPFSFPGRAALQDSLTAPLGQIFLAGDYLEFPNMEAAAATGFEAAIRVNNLLTDGLHCAAYQQID